MARKTRAERLEYPVILTPIDKAEGGGWLAEVPDLPGCRGIGKTQELALQNVGRVRDVWLYHAAAERRAAPEPSRQGDEYSGKFTLRMPKALHKRLVMLADAQAVSLNQLVLCLVSVGLGAMPMPEDDSQA